MLNTRLESHIESVYVAFVGAKSNSGVISAVVEHSGRYVQAKRDGQIANVVLRPRSGVALAVTKPLQDAGSPPAVGTGAGAGFWGRGVAANWTIRIEEDELSQSQVDLTELQEIQVWILYKSFLVNRLFTRGLDNLQDGSLLQNEETSEQFICYGNSRFKISDGVQIEGVQINMVEAEVLPSILITSIPTVPQARMLVREQNSDEIYLIDAGVKFRIGNVEKTGLKLNILPDHCLDDLPYGGVFN